MINIYINTVNKLMKIEYHGYVLEIIKEDNPSKLSFKCQEPNLKLFNGLRACITLESLVSSFKEEVDILLAKKEEQMKKLTIEYQNYKLEVEIYPITSTLLIPYIKGTCDCISFVKSGYYKNEDYSEIVNSFMEEVDSLIESKKGKDFEYKGYTLKLGVVETRKGGYCKELNYKTYGEDEEHTVIKFQKFVNWKIASIKKEDNSHTHLLTQLDRLAKKDKETNFTPFELRGQLVELYHLFGKILSLTLEDIHKLYFTKAEGEN